MLFVANVQLYRLFLSYFMLCVLPYIGFEETLPRVLGHFLFWSDVSLPLNLVCFNSSLSALYDHVCSAHFNHISQIHLTSMFLRYYPGVWSYISSLFFGIVVICRNPSQYLYLESSMFFFVTPILCDVV